MRSKLFVPGTRSDFFPKAMNTAADGVCFDLEDAVLEVCKAQARAKVRAFLLEDTTVNKGKTLIVRVNPIESSHFEDDIAAVAVCGVNVINLPKVESPEQVRVAADVLAYAEHVNGVRSPIGLLLNIETPKALHMASRLACAHSRVVGLQLGLGDLFEPLGISRHEVLAIGNAMLAVRMAAAQAGVYAYDGAFAHIADAEGFRAEAHISRSLGFLGKSCIHPSQVAIANAVYSPSREEIAYALKVVQAATQASAEGLGVCVVDGNMIDPPFEQRARSIVLNAQRWGLLDGNTSH